ncbi:Lar family restriction alleviation protein [Metapseudomonas otitidis]|uniref:Lar family restriction alleviation protein n=1 Tax=Metapseudomonas otitidis TaxID=319939 RepID=UPI00260DBDBD|nr:Lar family restriction alleviation protein [Pseudomonas otitidis]
MSKQATDLVKAISAGPRLLPPCPFCEGPPVAVVMDLDAGLPAQRGGDYRCDGMDIDAYVFCHECGAHGPSYENVIFDDDGYDSAEAEAVALWIQRTNRNHHLYDGSVRDGLCVYPARAAEQLTNAARDVLAERRRQVEDEQWTPEHDDRYRHRQLAMAAACYATSPAHDDLHSVQTATPAMPSAWPWARAWWKPGTLRQNLVKAGALVLAEIERLDRALMSTSTPAQRQAATMPTVPPRKGYTLQSHLAKTHPTAQELAGVAEQLAEGSGWWDACTGCHETEGGMPVGSYPYSEALRCSLGRGCTECGGIGAVWHRAKEWLPTVKEESALDQGVPDTNERTVIIPGCDQHEGLYSLSVTLLWACLHCGGPRGEPFDSLSFDGSRRLKVHSWSNPCGHIETYAEVRATLTGLPAGRPSEAEESQP